MDDRARAIQFLTRAAAILPRVVNALRGVKDDFPADLHSSEISVLVGAIRAVATEDAPLMAIPKEDFRLLFETAEDALTICSTCGAWLTPNDPARATVDGFSGCWKVALEQEDNGKNCRSYRAMIAAGKKP